MDEKAINDFFELLGEINDNLIGVYQELKRYNDNRVVEYQVSRSGVGITRNR